MDANYGWGERVQLKLEMPCVVVSDGDGTRGGIGNPLFGVKWRFLDEETAGRRGLDVPAVRIQPRVVLGGPRPRRQGVEFLLPVSAVKTVGPVAVNVEVGRVFESGGDGEWVWGLALGHTFGDVEALAEVFGTHGDDAVSRRVLVNLGGTRARHRGVDAALLRRVERLRRRRLSPRVPLCRPSAHLGQKGQPMKSAACILAALVARRSPPGRRARRRPATAS